jgi:O-methyltransferase
MALPIYPSITHENKTTNDRRKNMSVRTTVRSVIRESLHRVGYEIFRIHREDPVPGYPDLTKAEAEIIQAALPYTMTPVDRLYALINAVRYICTYKIFGAFVECGVWRGGSMVAAARTLMECGCLDRELYLFDTYEGMPKPQDVDKTYRGVTAAFHYETHRTSTGRSNLCYASLEDTQQVLYSTGYPKERVHFIKGKVEDTVPLSAPDKIALLRLDTDWYESSKHELFHLFPLLAPAGVLIIDDYGHWQGCRKAVDEYFGGQETPVLLNRIDYSSRIAVKPRL